jgi:endonuclease/exonuclease/phosphatase family metal-dependent hydrolase
MKFTLLQWNIWYLENADAVVDVIRSLSPDIACLQELSTSSGVGRTSDTGNKIKDDLSLYAHIGRAQTWKGRMIDSQGNGIFSKHPLLNCSAQFIREPHSPEIINYSQEGRVYLEASLILNNKELKVGTTHMSYSHRFEPSLERLEEDERLLKFLKNKKNFIFAADLNAHPRSHLINNLSEFLNNAGPELEENTWTTKPFDYNGFAENDLRWRLDYVFTTSELKIVSAEIIQTDVSDHLPILVEFEF